MLQGETAITIDDKGRLAIPTSYRDLVARECGNRLVVTYNPFEAGCLYLYPLPVWEKVRDQVNALPRTKKNSRLLQLKLVGAGALPLRSISLATAVVVPAPSNCEEVIASSICERIRKRSFARSSAMLSSPRRDPEHSRVIVCSFSAIESVSTTRNGRPSRSFNGRSRAAVVLANLIASHHCSLLKPSGGAKWRK